MVLGIVRCCASAAKAINSTLILLASRVPQKNTKAPSDQGFCEVFRMSWECLRWRTVAEREGFEPPVPVKVRLISSQVHSTGLCHLSASQVTLPRTWCLCLTLTLFACLPAATTQTVPHLDLMGTANAWTDTRELNAKPGTPMELRCRLSPPKCTVHEGRLKSTNKGVKKTMGSEVLRLTISRKHMRLDPSASIFLDGAFVTSAATSYQHDFTGHPSNSFLLR